jgi:hypothetical protein
MHEMNCFVILLRLSGEKLMTAEKSFNIDTDGREGFKENEEK